jgi:peptidoglycan/LPS O-acetylase OafA/YrhL
VTSPAASIEFTSDEHPRTRNRALDGLRAFAVAAVLAFHGGVVHMHGGYLGVDVFFVLSGFLITSLLVSEYETRRALNLGRFYLRRAKRLLPALLVVILAVSLGAWLLTPPGLYPNLHEDVLAAFFYVSNWHLMLGPNSYFTILNPPTPLTHTWSLAIEEQFYLLWPLVVIAVLGRRHRVGRLGLLAAAGAVASALEMALGYHLGWSVDRLYYGTDTHAQGLLLGAAAACLVIEAQRDPAALGPWSRRCLTALPVAGPVAIVAGLFLMQRAFGNSSWMFQGGFFAVALCSTVAVTYFVRHPGTVVARALSVRPLVYLGQISYGIYLWHFPIFHWLTSHATGVPVVPLFFLRVGVALAAAVLSYHLIEMPIRASRWPLTWRGAAVAGAAAALILATSLVAATVANDVPNPPVPAAATGVSHPVRVMMLGDSMMWTLADYLDNWGPHYGLDMNNGAIIGCGLVASMQGEQHGIASGRYNDCLLRYDGYFPLRRIWAQSIAAWHPDVVVVLAGRWEAQNLQIRGQWLNITQAAFRQRVTRSLGFIAADAAVVHAKLVYLTAPCIWDGEQLDGAPWPEDDPARFALYNHLLRHDAKLFHADVFDFQRLVCPSGAMQYRVHGYLLRTADGVHFQADAAPYIAPRLLPFLRRVGLANRRALAAARR